VKLSSKKTRPVHLRRNVGFWTVTTVPTVITMYSTVQITVGLNYGVRPYKTVPTVQYNFDHSLAVWLLFQPKTSQNSYFLFKQLFMNTVLYRDQSEVKQNPINKPQCKQCERGNT